MALVEGSTENATLVTELIVGLRERGLDVTRPILAVLDGSKALRRAVLDVFDRPVIGRCQLHKIRNVQDRLPEKLRSVVAARMRRAYHAESALAAEAELAALAAELDRTHPGAAASLREGMTETLTVLCLGVPPTLARTLRSTNEIVNPLIGRGLLWDPFSCSPAAQPGVAGPQPGSRWSARSAARTYDLDPGEDRRSVRRRWAWSDPVAKSRVWGCQPCRAASPREGLGSRAPVVAATSTPNLACPLLRAAVVRAGRVGCQAAIIVR